MGVQYLLHFMQSKNLYERMKVADAAQKYREEKSAQPVLLVDIASCIGFLPKGKTSLILGEVKKFKEICEEFLNQFHNLNIKLIIIGDGLKPQNKLQKWKDHNERAVKNSLKAYDTSNLKFLEIPRGYLLSIGMEVFSSSDKCEFHRDVYEADDYIASYVKTTSCFGVLTNDTDCILMDGSKYCFMMKDFNLKNMEVNNYNRDKLAEYLGIDVHLLPVWGTLSSKTFFPYRDLDNKTFFREVARTVKNFPAGEIILQDLPKYKSILSLQEHQVDEMRERLESLSGILGKGDLPLTEDRTWNNILILARINHSKGLVDKRLLEVLLEKVLYYPVGSEDLKMNTPDEELQNLRRKIYGFLFFEYPEEVTITEHLYELSQSSLKAEYSRCLVKVKKCEHIGLLKLWSPDVQEQKYKYFCQMINERLYAELFLGIVKEELIFPLLAVFYLDCELRKFPPIDLDALLMHSVLANSLSASEVDELSYKPLLYALNLSAWFEKVIQHLEFVNSVCGNPFDRKKTNIVNYFDGIVLHAVYGRMKALSPGANLPFTPEIQRTFQELKEVLSKMKKSCGFE